MTQHKVTFTNRQGEEAEIILSGCKSAKHAIKTAWKEEIAPGITFKDAKKQITSVKCKPI